MVKIGCKNWVKLGVHPGEIYSPERAGRLRPTGGLLPAQLGGGPQRVGGPGQPVLGLLGPPGDGLMGLAAHAGPGDVYHLPPGSALPCGPVKIIG